MLAVNQFLVMFSVKSYDISIGPERDDPKVDCSAEVNDSMDKIQ